MSSQSRHLHLHIYKVRSPVHENCRMCGVNCEFKAVHTIVITDSAERYFQASNLFFAGQQHRDSGHNSDQQDVSVYSKKIYIFEKPVNSLAVFNSSKQTNNRM